MKHYGCVPNYMKMSIIIYIYMWSTISLVLLDRTTVRKGNIRLTVLHCSWFHSRKALTQGCLVRQHFEIMSYNVNVRPAKI